MFKLSYSIQVVCVLLAVAIPVASFGQNVRQSSNSSSVSSGAVYQTPLRTVVMDDGSVGQVFANGENLPPLPEGYTRENDKSGMVAYFSPPVSKTLADQATPYPARALIPERVRDIIEPNGAYRVLITGSVTTASPLIEVPYRYLHVFQVTEDHVIKVHSLGRQKSLTLARKGTFGFYGGFSGNGAKGRSQIICYFPATEVTDYDQALCGLGAPGRTDAFFERVGVIGNLPMNYSVNSTVGVSELFDGFASTQADSIPHDFKMTLNFVSWSKQGVVLNWKSGKNIVVASELFPLNSEGEAVVDFVEGHLIVTPQTKNSKAATITWEPKASGS